MYNTHFENTIIIIQYKHMYYYACTCRLTLINTNHVNWFHWYNWPDPHGSLLVTGMGTNPRERGRIQHTLSTCVISYTCTCSHKAILLKQIPYYLLNSVLVSTSSFLPDEFALTTCVQQRYIDTWIIYKEINSIMIYTNNNYVHVQYMYTIKHMCS